MSIIRSIDSLFANHRIFPKCAFALLYAPHSQGGLALLEPVDQQLALQWRWLYPLLRSNTSSTSTSVVMRTLCFVFRHFLLTSFLLITHISNTQQYPSFFSFVLCQCIHLSLSAFLVYSWLCNFPYFLFCLFCSTINHSLFVTRDSTNSSPTHRNLNIVAVSFIQQGHLVLIPFFSFHMHIDLFLHHGISIIDNILDLQLFCLSIVTSSMPLSSGYLANSIRYYKLLVLIHSNMVSPLFASDWRSYCLYYIPLYSRTIWFRAIHNKITSR